MDPARKIHPRKWYETVRYTCARNTPIRRSKNPYRAEILDYATREPVKKTRASALCFYRFATRFLESRIGRPWHKVHAEICSRIRDIELRRDVLKMVETDVVIVGGVVYGSPSRWSKNHHRPPLFRNVYVASDGLMYPSCHSSQDLFVHPRTGILYGSKSHYAKQLRALKRTTHCPFL